MSYGAREKFYKSKAWEDVRKTIWLKQNMLCYYCKKPVYVYGVSDYIPKPNQRRGIVHHKIELNDINVYDTNITLNPDNLIGVCLECHNIIHNSKQTTRQEYTFDSNGNLIKKDIYK